jgi:YHS domain-containing protein/phosphohistidine phosphatase SixA
MKMKKLLLGVLLLFSSTNIFSQITTDSVTTIILVRHAEKQKDGTKNPTLTDEGIVRAIELAYILREEPIAAVFSTDYERTLKTAKPTAEFHELPVQKYLVQNHNSFLENVLRQYWGKTVLIVGHSNTVPAMLDILTGGNHWKIEDYMYNDLFIVNTIRKGEWRTLHLKYGKMSEPPIIENINEKGVAIHGYDVVAYFLGTSAAKGSVYYSSIHQGIMYYFSSQDNLNQFMINPEKYLPQYGGWCASKMSTFKGNPKQDIDPNLFKIIDGKLYLFGKNQYENGLELWNKTPYDYNIKRANVTWELLKSE